MKPLDEIPTVPAAFQPMELPRNEWRAPFAQAVAWPSSASLEDLPVLRSALDFTTAPLQSRLRSSASGRPSLASGMLDDPLAINPWLATAMRIVSFSILVFMAFVASAP